MKSYKVLILLIFIVVNSCSKEDEINQLNETIVNLQNDIVQLNTQINDFSYQVNQLTTQNNTLSSEVEDALTQNNTLSIQIDDLNGQLNNFQVQIQEYIDQIEVLNESNEILQSDNNNLNAQVLNLKDQLYSIQSQTAKDGIYLFNKVELSEPPFRGSLWELPDLITSTDYSIYSSYQYFGIENRLFYDQSIPDFLEYPAHIMKINFGDGLSIDFEIYQEYSFNEAIQIKDKYSPLIGQLGKSLRQGIKSFEFMTESVIASAQRSDDLSYANITFHPEWIQGVVMPYPGGDRTEELLIHEASHLSIDPFVYGDVEWSSAVQLDGNYISNYAMEFPEREDIAETFQAYIAVKYFPDRISNSLRDTILSVCLNRFIYFDSLNLDLTIYK
jgi:hypothetical protein